MQETDRRTDGLIWDCDSEQLMMMAVVAQNTDECVQIISKGNCVLSVSLTGKGKPMGTNNNITSRNTER